MGTLNLTDPAPRLDALLDLEGVARYANVSVRMARRILDERRVPVVRIGRHRRVRESDLTAWLIANTTEAVTK